MSRVINTDSTGKQRNQLLRTIAELLRHLSQKPTFDDTSRDMLALLVYCLREIDSGIDVSAIAWEKRDYWMKADELRRRYLWVNDLADQLQQMCFSDNYDGLPNVMMKLVPHVSDIKVTKFTRTEMLWNGAYARLLREKPGSS